MAAYQFNSIARATSGPTNDPTRAVAIFACLGTTSPDSTIAVNVPTLFRNDRDPYGKFVAGPVPELAGIVSGYSQQSTIGLRLTEDAPGGYGVIDVSGFTGTVVPSIHAATVPNNDHEIYILFTSGGTLGTPGANYRTSLDGGRSYVGGKISLGADIRIEVENAEGVVVGAIDLAMPSAVVTALVTLVAEERTQTLAHFAEGTTVHTAADAASGAGISAAPVTLTDAIDVVNDLWTAWIAHATNNAAHVADDMSSFASPPAVATNGPTAVVRANALRTAINAHLALTGSVHGSLPATADVASPDPGVGTIVLSDVIQFTTTAPTFDAAAMTAAMTALAGYKATAFGGIAIRGRFPVDAWTALINGLDLLRANQRPVIAIIEARLPNDGESQTDYRISLEAEWDGLYDARVYVIAQDGRYNPTTLAQTRYQSRRPHTAPLTARLAALDFGESPGVIKSSSRSTAGVPSKFGGPLDGYAISNADSIFGTDAYADQGLQEAGFGVLTTVPNKPVTDCYVFEPLTRAPAGDTAPHIAMQRIALVIELVMYIVGTNFVQSRVLLERGRTVIRADAADQLDGLMFSEVANAVGDPNKDGSRITSFFFRTDRNADISGTPTVIPWSAEAVTGRYVSRLSGTFAVNRSV